MYGNSVKQMKVKFIVSFILGIVLVVFFWIAQFRLGYKFPLGVLTLYTAVAVLVFPFEVMAFVLNWRKIFVGIIKPIPILSYFIQCFVGIFMAFKAFIWMLKNWKNDEL